MAGLKKCNPGNILQAVETQLIAYNGSSIVPTNDAIYWLRVGDEPPGKPSGKRDILLVVSNELVSKERQVGGGRLGLLMELFIEVHLRTIMLLDRVNTYKDALIDHWNQKDAIIDALETFYPTDAAGNGMTLEALRLDAKITPHPDRLTPKWGESIGTWRAHYLPNVAQTPIG